MNRYLSIAALPTLFLSALCTAPVAFSEHDADHNSLDEDQHHGQHAHVHGEAALTLAQDHSELFIELDSPAIDLVGFEHEPESDGERALVNATAYQLKQLNTLLTLPKKAGCTVTSSNVESNMLDTDHDGHSHEHDGDSDFVPHSDFTVSYTLNCTAPQAINSLQINLFKTYKSLKEVDVEWVINGHQSSAAATPKAPNITIK